MDERSREEILKYFYLRAGGSFRELPLLLEDAAKADASDAQGIKARIDQWYEKKIQPIKDVLAETEEEEEEEEGWLEKLFRELRGEKKPKKEPKSKYLDLQVLCALRRWASRAMPSRSQRTNGRRVFLPMAPDFEYGTTRSTCLVTG
ncbi:unnamed protein product [Symbiodinium sp. CCMP2592]|nr:unnamed protein product [Symbiodinium sp. CCMP2592]